MALVVQSAVASALIAMAPAPSGPLRPAAAPAATGVDGDGRTVRVVGLGGPSTAALLDRVRRESGAAVEAVERFWGTDWTREIVVIAAGTDAQFAAAARLDPQRQWSDIAAVAVADEVDPARRYVSGQRIVLAPGASAMSDTALRIVMAHELFHLAARPDTAVDAPEWLTEGVADFVARPPAPVPVSAARNTSLPSDAELDMAGPARAAGYDRAWWFARFVADTYGVEGLRRLYDRACGPGRADFATAVRQVLGADLDTVRTEWARWLSG